MALAPVRKGVAPSLPGVADRYTLYEGAGGSVLLYCSTAYTAPSPDGSSYVDVERSGAARDRVVLTSFERGLS